MRQSFWTETKVGLFVIVGAAILAVGVSMVGKFRWGKPEGYTVTGVFSSISGLEEKAPVRISGVRVGEVEKISLKDGMAIVKMRLSPEAVIREDSEVTVSSLGLLGEKYVEITSGSLSKPAVRAGAAIQGKDVASMDKLIAEFTDIATDIKAVTNSLRSFLGPEQDKSPLTELIKNFEKMVANIDGLVSDNRQGIKGAVASVNSFAGKVDRLVADNQEDVRTAIRNFRDLTQNLQTQVNTLSDKFGRAADNVTSSVSGAKQDFSAALEEVKKAAARINDTVASLKEIVDKTRRGEGTIGKLFNDDTTYRSFNKTLDSLSDVSQKLSRGEGTLGKLLTDEGAYKSFNEAFQSINRFVTRGEQIRYYTGFRSEYLTEPGESKGYFTLRINPREDKFYLLEVTSDPRGRRSTVDSTTTTSVDGSTTTVTTSQERFEDKLAFSLEIGKRFSDLILRAGLIESTGGAGADLLFAQDRGKLSLEIFDAARKDANPHLKLSGSYKIYKDVYLTAGVDEMIEEKYRSFFAGAGILFSDEDIKYLVGLFSLGK